MLLHPNEQTTKLHYSDQVNPVNVLNIHALDALDQFLASGAARPAATGAPK
jgi:hypothetical protein